MYLALLAVLYLAFISLGLPDSLLGSGWPDMHVALDVVRDRKNETPGHAGKKYTNAVLEGRYYLSPRSFIYGAVLRLDGENNWGVGLRLNF